MDMYVCYYVNEDKIVKFDDEFDFWCWMDDHNLIGKDDYLALYYEHDVTYEEVTCDILHGDAGNPNDTFFGYEELYYCMDEVDRSFVRHALLAHMVPNHFDDDGNIMVREPIGW